MARIADSSFIDDSIGVFIDNINQINPFLGNLDSIRTETGTAGSRKFNVLASNPLNTNHNPRAIPPAENAVQAVNYLKQKVDVFSFLLFSSLPPNMENQGMAVDSAFIDNLTGNSLRVPISPNRPIPGFVGVGDSVPGDSDYYHTGLLAIDSARIKYLSGENFKVGSNYLQSPHAGYFTLLNNPSYNGGTGKVFFDSSENVDFGLVVDVGRIQRLTGPPANANPPFPFPMLRRSSVDSGFEQDSGVISYDSGRFNQLMVGNFFIADSTPTIDSSDFETFKFPTDSNNFRSLEFNSLHFDSNDTFNLPLRRVQRMSIMTDSGVDNLSAFLLSPWDSSGRIT